MTSAAGRLRQSAAAAVAGLTLLFVGDVGCRSISPPAQSADGPGGRRAWHHEVRATAVGSGDTRARVFEPAEPAPAEAPVVGDETARLIWKRIRHLPKRDRWFVEIVSDRRGSPALVADHWFSASPRDGTPVRQLRILEDQ